MLKKLREKAGLSQSELAKKSGVSVRIIQHYEQGFRDIKKANVMTVIALADALGCDIKKLVK